MSSIRGLESFLLTQCSLISLLDYPSNLYLNDHFPFLVFSHLRVLFSFRFRSLSLAYFFKHHISFYPLFPSRHYLLSNLLLFIPFNTGKAFSLLVRITFSFDYITASERCLCCFGSTIFSDPKLRERENVRGFPGTAKRI